MEIIDPISNPAYTYVQAADLIGARIEQGQYKERLPGERALSAELGIAVMTVRHAIELLRVRGLVITRHGRGTFVIAGLEAAAVSRQPD